MNATENMIASMLKENTGITFMDSGGDNGRNWQRNAGRNFANEPSQIVQADYGYLSLHLNTYHFLTERLNYVPGYDSYLQEYYDQIDGYFYEIADFAHILAALTYSPDFHDVFDTFRKGDCLPEELVEAAKVYNEVLGLEPTGLYGEGEIATVNSYNYESLLDQVIQYAMFEIDGDVFYLLQIHGGADVRGSYTAPRLFADIDEGSLYYDTSMSIYCSDCDCTFDYSDGYVPSSFYNTCKNVSFLKNYGLLTTAEIIKRYPFMYYAVGLETTLEFYNLYLVNDNGSIPCPECEEGVLQ